MKAIFINSKEKTVTDILLDGHKPMLQQWYALIGCDRVEQCHCMKEHNHSILVDEDGFLKLTDQSTFFYYQGAFQPYAGNGIVSAVDFLGNTIDVDVTAEEIKKNITFYSYDQINSKILLPEF